MKKNQESTTYKEDPGLFKKRINNDIEKLINEIERLKQQSEQEIPIAQQLSVQMENSDLQRLMGAMNELIATLQTKHESLYVKHQIVTELNGIGTWDLELENGVPAENNNYNQLFRRILGYEDETDFPNVFESWYNTIAPDEVEAVTNAFKEHYSLETKKPYDIEFKSVKKDGSSEWYRAKAQTVRNENGEPYRNVGTLVNIHESKVNTIRIQNLLSRLELIEKSLGYSVSTLEGSWGMDLKNNNSDNQVWFSPQFKRLVGYDENEFEPHVETWLNLVVEEDRESVKNNFNSHLYGNTDQTELDMKFPMKIKNGDDRWFTMLIKTVRDYDGKPTLVSGVLRDINHEIERKAYDEKIESEMNVFTNSLRELAGNINDISNEATEIAYEHAVTTKSADEAKERIEMTKSVIDLIKKVSTQTNLLGLNASIEAARAGEQGRGFSVVAQEVQKLSSSTAEAVEEIEKILEDINSSVRSIVKSINNMSHKIQSQAAVTEEINSTTENLHGMSGRLLSLIEKLD